MLGLDVPVDIEDAHYADMGQTGLRHRYPAVLLRLLLTAAALYVWFQFDDMSEAFVAQAVADPNCTTSRLVAFSDPGHAALSTFYDWLLATGWATRLCTASSIISELVGAAIVSVSVLGTSFRPMLSMIFVYLLRSLLLAAGSTHIVGAPAHATDWPVPDDLPALFVKRGGTPFFFSARVALTTVASLELLSITVHSDYGIKSRHVQRLAAVIAVAILGLDIILSIALKQSWTFDVVVAIVFARYCTIGAHRCSPWFDAFMP